MYRFLFIYVDAQMVLKASKVNLQMEAKGLNHILYYRKL
jgi:hypothetical protein